MEGMEQVFCGFIILCLILVLWGLGFFLNERLLHIAIFRIRKKEDKGHFTPFKSDQKRMTYQCISKELASH